MVDNNYLEGGGSDGFGGGQPAGTSVNNTRRRYGVQAWNDIADIFQQATGREATDREVMQWGSNIDARYLNTIRTAVNNTEEARRYRERLNAPPSTPPAETPQQPAAPSSPVTPTGQMTPSTAVPSGTHGPLQQPSNIKLNMPTAPQAPMTFAQFQQQSGSIPSQQQSLLQGILSNPLTMSPEAVNSLKQKQLEQEVAMRDQMNAQMASRFAGLNRSGSGQQLAGERATNENLISSLLSGYRDVDLQKMQQDRADTLGAVNAAQQYLTENYQNQLAGSQAGLQNYLAQLQAALGEGNFNLGQEQFNSGYNLDVAQLMEQIRQHNNNLGFNYANLGMQGQNSLLQFLINSGLI